MSLPSIESYSFKTWITPSSSRVRLPGLGELQTFPALKRDFFLWTSISSKSVCSVSHSGIFFWKILAIWNHIFKAFTSLVGGTQKISSFYTRSKKIAICILTTTTAYVSFAFDWSIKQKHDVEWQHTLVSILWLVNFTLTHVT